MIYSGHFVVVVIPQQFFFFFFFTKLDFHFGQAHSHYLLAVVNVGMIRIGSDCGYA